MLFTVQQPSLCRSVHLSPVLHLCTKPSSSKIVKQSSATKGSDYFSLVCRLVGYIRNAGSSSLLVFCSRAGPWHLVLDLSLFPSLLFWLGVACHPAGTPMVSITWVSIPYNCSSSKGSTGLRVTLAFVPYFLGDLFFWGGSPRPSSVNYYDRLLRSATVYWVNSQSLYPTEWIRCCKCLEWWELICSGMMGRKSRKSGKFLLRLMQSIIGALLQHHFRYIIDTVKHQERLNN